MPTMFGTIWAQYVTGTFAYNASGTISVHPNNRNVTAYASLAYFSFIIPSNGHHPPYLRSAKPGFRGSSPTGSQRTLIRLCSSSCAAT